MRITEMLKLKKLLMTLVLLPLMASAAVETTADGYSWTFSREGKGVKITNVSPELSGSVTFPAKLGGLDVVNIVWDDLFESEETVENWDVEELFVPSSLADSLANGLMNVIRNDGKERRISGCKDTEASWGIVFGRFRALYHIDIVGESSRWSVIGESIYTKDRKTLVFHPAGNWSLTLSRDVCSVIDQIEVWEGSRFACVGCCDPGRWVLFHSNIENVDDVYATDIASITRSSFGMDHGWWLSTGATEEPDWQQVSATRKIIGDHIEEVTQLVVNEDLPGCAFSGCLSLQEVFLGENARTIGYDAFRGCSNLAVVKGGTGLVRVDWGAFRETPFRDCVKEGPVMIGSSWIVDFKGIMPESLVIPDGVRGFSFDCHGLLDLTLPSSFCMDGSFVFGGNLRVPSLDFWLKKQFVVSTGSGCDAVDSDGYMLYAGGALVTTVAFPGSLEGIPNDAFHDCKSLNSVTLGEGITEIGESAFSGCINLFTAELPTTLKKIGAYAFDGCPDLDFELPPYVDEIGEDAFYGTYALEEAKETARKTKTVAYLRNWLVGWCGDSKDYDGPSSLTIKSGTRGVLAGAFVYCYGLKSVTFPSGLVSIGANAFACTGVTSVKLPAGLKVIGAHAFGGSKLAVFPTLPSSLERVGNDVFNYDDWGDNGVTPAYAKAAKGFVVKDGWLLGYKQYDYVLDPEWGYYLSNEDSFVEKPNAIVLPTSVKHIADRVFWDDWDDGSIESIDVPASVLTIGRDALSEVKNTVILRGKPPKVDLDEEGDSPFYNAKVGYFIAGTAGWTAGEKFYGLPMEPRIVSGGKLVETRTVHVKVEGDGSVSGAGDFVAGKKVTLKATAKKGYVFAGWFSDADCTQPIDGTVDYRTASFPFVMPAQDIAVYAKFVAVAEDAARLSVANIAEGETFVVDDSWMKKVEIDSYSIPSVSAKGLPAGLKFDAKTLMISGKPTKPGKYDVELLLKNTSVKTAKKFTFKIAVPNLESDLIAGGIDYASDAYTYVAGTKIAPILPVLSEGVTVKAAGLPSGLKLVGGKNGVPYSIEGTSTAKPGAYTVTLALAKGEVKETATITVNIENRKLDLVLAICDGSLTNGCKVTGCGSYAAGKKVTLKATAAKGAVFAGWYLDPDCTEPLEGSVDYRTASYSYVTTDRDVTIYAKFVPAADDKSIDLVVNGNEVVDDSGAVQVVVKDEATLPAVEIGSVSLPKASVKGLPAGLKWDAKKNCFTGSPTKPGVYKVTFSLTNMTVKKAIVRAFTIEVPNFESPAFPGLKSASGAYPVSVGVAALPAVDAGLASAYAGYTVKVTGLPSGLSWKSGVLTGLAKKAGDYTVTFTATKGKDKQVSTITIHVEALPDWTVGTFVGMVRQVDRDESGEIVEDEDGLHDWYDILTTVSVTSAGKVSGKLHFESGADVSFKSDSISERTDAGYVVRGQLKARGIASDFELLLRKIGIETTGVGDLGAVDVLMRQTARQEGSNWIECDETTFSTKEDAPLRQNVWSSKKLPLPPSVNGVKKTVTVEDNIYTLTFGKNGSVKVSLAKADKPMKAIASGSATLSIVGHASEVWHCALCTSVVVKKNDYGAVCIFDVTILEDGTVTCVPQK